MPPCNSKTFTTLSQYLQKSLRYDFTDKYFIIIVVSTPSYYLTDFHRWDSNP
ncbi:hypothetical protein AAJ76_2400013812 [Vairimorpha ceranae]|uniref:Uncharacterized protein n=1 Tax=Vairimorpha ceranae TaxID=40302 RepID=A0A0F9WEV3_9MICR|nr:hypothetical protein AAJ76_2400013812 [Vairimorpha ceranae]KKO75315.1 hypothetical protein AAJ76_2400013812 [Vairimorpha ceranae]